jgi:hypothetical protein
MVVTDYRYFLDSIPCKKLVIFFTVLICCDNSIDKIGLGFMLRADRRNMSTRLTSQHLTFTKVKRLQ